MTDRDETPDSGRDVRTWLVSVLGTEGGSAEAGRLRDLARADSIHERTLRREAARMERDGLLVRTHHGSRTTRSVTWTLVPGRVCAACGHPVAGHAPERDVCAPCHGVCRRTP